MVASVNTVIPIGKDYVKIASAGQTIEEMQLPENAEMFVHFMPNGATPNAVDQKDDNGFVYDQTYDNRHIGRTLSFDMYGRTNRGFDLRILII